MTNSYFCRRWRRDHRGRPGQVPVPEPPGTGPVPEPLHVQVLPARPRSAATLPALGPSHRQTLNFGCRYYDSANIMDSVWCSRVRKKGEKQSGEQGKMNKRFAHKACHHGGYGCHFSRPRPQVSLCRHPDQSFSASHDNLIADKDIRAQGTVWPAATPLQVAVQVPLERRSLWLQRWYQSQSSQSHVGENVTASDLRRPSGKPCGASRAVAIGMPLGA